MSRTAVYALLTNDPELQTYNINHDSVFHNYITELPPPAGPFVILLWGEFRAMFGRNGQDALVGRQLLTVETHSLREYSTDFTDTHKILARVRTILTSALGVTGTDGYVLSQARFTGESGDAYNDTHKTIVRSAAFEVVARKV